MILNIAQSKEFAQNELEALTCIAEPSIVLLMEAFIKVLPNFFTQNALVTNMVYLNGYYYYYYYQPPCPSLVIF